MKNRNLTYEEIMALHQKTDEKIDKMVSEFDKILKDLTKKLEHIGASNGKVATDVIFNKLNKSKRFGGILFDEVKRELRKIGKDRTGAVIDGEYDVLLLNGTAVGIIDVKYRARVKDIDYLIDTQMPKFKILFPKYRKFKVYLGLGALSFEQGVVRRAKKLGIGIFKTDENIVRVEDKYVAAW